MTEPPVCKDEIYTACFHKYLKQIHFNKKNRNSYENIRASQEVYKR
jgi:hypothetical protein